MPPSPTGSLRVRFLRFAFHHFYNTFAWTYDAVSAAISLGHWHAWTRAALPYLRGQRVLEIAFGTGNLQLDLYAAGFKPFGADLSPNMVRITAQKLARAKLDQRLVRASVLNLPYADGAFDSIVLTFPPNFLGSAQSLSEMRRVLASGGRIALVDNGQLHQPLLISALVNVAFRLTGGAGAPDEPGAALRAAGFAVSLVWAGDARSGVHVLLADKQTVG